MVQDYFSELIVKKGGPFLRRVVVPSTVQSPTRIRPQVREALAYRAGDLREHSIGVGPDQSNSTHYYDQNHCHHYGVFGDVLTVFR